MLLLRISFCIYDWLAKQRLFCSSADTRCSHCTVVVNNWQKLRCKRKQATRLNCTLRDVNKGRSGTAVYSCRRTLHHHHHSRAGLVVTRQSQGMVGLDKARVTFNNNLSTGYLSAWRLFGPQQLDGQSINNYDLIYSPSSTTLLCSMNTAKSTQAMKRLSRFSGWIHQINLLIFLWLVGPIHYLYNVHKNN